MKSIKLLLISFSIIFLASCSYEKDLYSKNYLKNQFLNMLNTLMLDLKVIDIEIGNITQNIDETKINSETIFEEEIPIEERLNKLNENIAERGYGVKNETFEISDSFNEIVCKINYPVIYTIDEDKIECLNEISEQILELLFVEIYDSLGRMNKTVATTFNDEVNYKISYIDKNFLSIDYSWNHMNIIGFANFILSLTMNLFIDYDKNDKIKSIKILELEDIISVEEIIDIIKNDKFKDVGGVDGAIAPIVENVKNGSDKTLEYSLKSEFLLCDNNKLVLFFSVPSSEGGIFLIEIDYNWKDKLTKLYK